MNITRMSLLERLLAKAIGDRNAAAAIVGDFAEERVRFPTLHLLALTARFAVRRAARSRVPSPRSRIMSNLAQDLRYAVRVLRRQPGFALVVVLTLAVGLGANAAVFAMVDGMLLRPLPVAGVDGMVEIFETNAAQGDERELVSPPDYFDWQQRATSFERLLAFEWWDASLSDGSHEPEQVVTRRVSVGFFEALRVSPAIGRTFAAGEDTIGNHRVAIVSHRLWQRRWGASPALVGSTISINREPYTIVGIAPAGFEYPSGTEMWAPITFDAKAMTQRAWRSLEVIARLKPGAAIDQAQAEMQKLAAQAAAEHPDTNAGYGANVMPLSRAMLDLGTPAVIVMLQLAVLLVLLIAGANAANLLMVRGAARQRELALRLAVGASRWRVVRQLVVESVVLAVVGVCLAMLIAAGGVRAMKAFMPPEIARWILGWSEIDIDLRLMGVTMAAGVLAGAVFGALPALRASRPELAGALKEGARSAGGRRRVLEGFVVAQVALALALLVSAGLSTRGAIRLLTQNDGYDPRGVMTFGVTLPEKGYPDDETRLRFFEEIVTRVRPLPGVETVAFSTTVPFSNTGGGRPVEVAGRPPSQASEQPQMDYRVISPDFFRVIRASVLRGRNFAQTDRAGTPPVAIINRLMAERLWPGADPIGQRFRAAQVADAPWLTVVGVASNVKHDWFFGYRPTYYVPLAQAPRDYGVLSVRTAGDENAIAPAVRRVFRELDPHLPLANVHSLLRWRSLKTVGMQFVAGLMASFAGIGLFLSAIGIYGVMAYSVNQRTREIGVRMALGATAAGVMGMTLRTALSLTGIGIGIGLVVALGLSKLLIANLFGVVRLEGDTFAVFAVVLGVVAVIASTIPVRRAMRVDPISALRAE